MKIPVQVYLRSALILVGIACAGMPDHSQACNVPAFRYALERWPADSYQILVYDRSGPQGAAFELLQKGASERGGAANYSLKGIDVTKPEGKALAEQRSVVAYPWVEIYYPIHLQVRTPVWSGPLTLDRAKKILNSPGRSRLAQRLLSGEVAVWILIRSGHDQKDRRALESLKSHLDWASATLRIPDTGADVNGNPIEVTDFKTYPVRFGLMEIAHDAPDEDLLVNALLKSEPDLGRYGEPMAFPVFGRGRALYALVGDGIQEKNIREACQSMLAWCSCEIKALNPGTDLLISADWSRPFGGRMVKDLELPLTGLSGFLPKQESAETAVPRRNPEPAGPVAVREAAPAAGRAGGVPTAAPVKAARSGESPLVRNVLYLAGAAGVVLLALSVFLTVKAKR
jgi:hypothetical protein